MTEESKDEAKELAGRAANQAKHAGKNTARAARVVVEPVIDGAAEEVRDTADKLGDTAEDAVNTAVKGWRKLGPDAGIAALSLAVSLGAGVFAYSKFRYIRGYAMGVAAAQAEHTTPPGA